MSLPRAVVAGRCCLVTRRCSERRFFLKPSRRTNQAFWYVLARAARKHNVGVVAACAMSNHYHLVVVDNHGRVPAFLRDFNSLLAKCMNANWGRWEPMWDGAQTSVVHLTDDASQLEKTTYVLTNPVKDHLVGAVTDWPGANSFVEGQRGRAVVAKRPDWFFKDRGETTSRENHVGPRPAQAARSWTQGNDVGKARAGKALPETETLTFMTPPDWEKEDFRQALADAVQTTETQAAADRAQSKRKVMGRQRVRAQHWNHAPTPTPSAEETAPASPAATSGVASRP